MKSKLILCLALALSGWLAGCATDQPAYPLSRTAFPEPGIYLVQPADSATRIAKNLCLTVERLSELNPGVDWSHLKIGLKLYYAPPPALSTAPRFAPPSTGFLLFEVERYPYSQKDGRANGAHVKQGFKVPLNEEFMSQFKNPPVPYHSMGTGLYCSAGFKADVGSTGFMWWIHRTDDNRWSINMWGAGTETVAGVKIDSRYSVSKSMKIKELQDLYMAYQLSYAGAGSGLNVGFTVKYVSAKDTPSLDTIPVAPVQKADRSELFKGDDQSRLPVGITCGFQEN